MYENVKAEMARKNMSITDLAEATGIRYQTLTEKLRGKTPIKLSEAVRIKWALNLTMPLEDLFGTEVIK